VKFWRRLKDCLLAVEDKVLESGPDLVAALEYGDIRLMHVIDGKSWKSLPYLPMYMGTCGL